MIAEAAARRPAVLVVFDVLELQGEDLRPLPLIERRHEHIEPTPGVHIIEHVETHGERCSTRSSMAITMVCALQHDTGDGGSRKGPATGLWLLLDCNNA